MKNWIIAFATEKFYVTKEDADFYASKVAQGAKFVALKNGMMLSDKALYIVDSQIIESSKKIESGQWQCEAKKWHNKGVSCYCNVEWKEIDGRMTPIKSLVEKNI